jgi:hypothetical protein
LLQGLAAVVILWHGTEWLQLLLLHPEFYGVFDFYQEWGSARNWHEGLPVYAPQIDTLKRHLGLKYVSVVIRYNAHPPPVILLSLPLGWLDYMDALACWQMMNLLLVTLSIAVTLRTLDCRFSGWWVLPAVALVLMFNPFRQQCLQGQLNGVLLTLITLAWAAERRCLYLWAGIALGLATAIKLFPGWLVLGMLLRRRWAGVCAAVAVFLTLHACSWAVLGQQAYQDYLQVVLPDLQRFRFHVTNASILGFGHKLLIGNPVEHSWPLWEAPVAAWILIGTLSVIVAVLALRTASQPQSAKSFDVAVGINITAMLLLSPLTWDHSLLLLLPWLITTACYLPPRIIPWCCFGFILLSMIPDHVRYWFAQHQQRFPEPLTKGAALVASSQQMTMALPATVSLWTGTLAIVHSWILTPVVPMPTHGRELLGHKGLPFFTLLGWLALQVWLHGQVQSSSQRDPSTKAPVTDRH